MNDPKPSWQLAIVYACIEKFYEALPDDGVSRKEFEYINPRNHFPSEGMPFEPHGWVIDAMNQAHALGKLAGEADGRKTGDFVAEQQAEQYKGEMTGAVRATIATMMEALDEGGPGIPYVTLDPKKLATIYDRVTLDFHQEDDGRFTYRMFRGANAPVPSIAPLVPVKLDDAEARDNTQRNHVVNEMVKIIQKEHPLWTRKRLLDEAKTRVTSKLGISNDGGTLRVIKAD